MQSGIVFTVFTPTYNRKNLLSKVYECLKQQTYTSFEWVVIDDGSTDGTEELVKEWQQNAPFDIVYQWQPNQGKHIAYNTVAKIARGPLFTNIDSDDEIIPTALERLKFHWDNLGEDQKEIVGGITFNSMDQFGKLVGTPFPEDYQITDLMEMFFVNRVEGDKGGMMQTRALRMYPFPEDIKNVYVPENSFMFKFARDWKMCFINETLRIYWIEGRKDSLSLISTTKRNYAGSLYSHQCFLNYNMRFFFKRPKLCLGEATRYTRLSLHLRVSLAKQWSRLKPLSARLLWISMLPLGIVFYIKDKLQAK